MGEAEAMGAAAEEGVGEQLGAAARPAVVQAAGQGQGVQEDAPAVEKVPGGQRLALTEDRGQAEPAGQRRGAPLPQ